MRHSESYNNRFAMVNRLLIAFLPFFAFSLLILNSCGNNEKEELKSKALAVPGGKKIIKEKKIEKVIFFIENSGSMLGYVKEANDYKNAIVSLSYLQEIDSFQKEFYFINGTNNPLKNSKISVNFIGNNPEQLENSLNQTSFITHGDPKYSDLTTMFEKALESTRNGAISILISDCIYDVGEERNPIAALKIETEKTKKVFRDVLAKQNIQTIIIKAESRFKGNYYYASKKGSRYINQKRPFYILIFGESNLLNTHFKDDIISKNIEGFVSIARFMKIDAIKIPYRETTENLIGSFKSKEKTILKQVKPGPKGFGFQFSFAVDYSSLPFSNSFLESWDNYSCNQDYTLIKPIIKPSKKILGLDFNPTHLITVFSDKSHYGNIEIVLKYGIPDWIRETNSTDENSINQDTLHTFGFEALTNAITETYQYEAQTQKLAIYKFQILKN